MLNQNQINEISQAVRELTEGPSCCAEAREAAERWLASAGTPAEAEASKALVAEMEDDLVTVDGLIAFAESEAGIGHFGAETAAAIAAHGRELKASGAAYCDCPACTAAKAILDFKELLLG